MVWQKITIAFNVCGALLGVPAGAVGLYSAYQTNFSTEVACRDLRGSILLALEKNVDARTKHILVAKDLAQFQQSCALSDPEAKTVFESIDRHVLFADKSGEPPDSRPVKFVPPWPWLSRHHWRGVPDLAPPPRWSERPFGA